MTALVVEPERNRGGFFRWHHGRLRAHSPSEFYELVARGADGTVVDWTNHASAGGLRPETSSSMPALRLPREAGRVEAPAAPALSTRAAFASGLAGGVLGALLCAGALAGFGGPNRQAPAAPVAPYRAELAPIPVEAPAPPAAAAVDARPEPPSRAAARPRRARPKRAQTAGSDPLARKPDAPKQAAPATPPQSPPTAAPAPRSAGEGPSS
jgi:hypothetical protein